MRTENKFLNALAAVWEMLVDFPLPPVFRGSASPEPEMLLLAFPLVGAVLGLIPVLAGALTGMLFNRIAGAVIFALAAGIVLGFKDSGRGVLLLSSFVTRLMAKESRQEALRELRHDAGVLDAQPAAIFVTLFAVVELGILFLLSFYGAQWWIVAVAVAGATVQGVLATEPRSGGRPGLIPQAEEKKGFSWFSAGVLFLFLLLRFPRPAALLAGVAVFLLVRFFIRDFRDAAGGVDADFITLGGAVTESAVLLLGLGVLNIG